MNRRETMIGLALAACAPFAARAQAWHNGALLALGHHSPVFRVFHAVMPGAGLFRVPAIFYHLVVNSDRYDAASIFTPEMVEATILWAQRWQAETQSYLEKKSPQALKP